MLLKEVVLPWPPWISQLGQGETVDALVLHEARVVVHRHVMTSYLDMEFKDSQGWPCHAFIFSEDEGYLKKLLRILGKNTGKTIGELGNVACPP